ncbi:MULTISPECIES: hypothetical protein [unclassified Rathayibacter]|uniref:hypothetical protein n=1 Tax=unclassified Rathayibacter TaxID=2609250 RepID=UPI000F4C0EB6|nr:MULTISPECIES: hypothetical protein [unclassified Rathayibacter]ROP48772.1 hypothetical protein EDF45_2890 [Rathayibacter sp. PhB186]ROS49921.1 hypothetical protein EDF44_2892 [Rathayibacter sp. PhB185]
MAAAPTPDWGAPPPHASAHPLPSDPLPPRRRFEPTALITSPAEVRRARGALAAQLRQTSPANRRRLAEFAAVADGVALLRGREFDRALRRIAAPAAAVAPDATGVVTLGPDGPALAGERADALAIADWSDVLSVEVGTVAHGAFRVRAVVLAVLAARPERGAAAGQGFRGLVSEAARSSAAALAARARRRVLVPLVVATPGPLGWTVADDRTFLLALDRVRRAHGAR